MRWTEVTRYVIINNLMLFNSKQFGNICNLANSHIRDDWRHMTSFLQPHTVRLDNRSLKLLKYWTWQFVVIRPVCSILMITLQIVGMYPTWLSWVFTIILNISVSLALYSLVVFYHVFAKELEPHKPLAKFMFIKGIVFFCFWQVIKCATMVNR